MGENSNHSMALPELEQSQQLWHNGYNQVVKEKEGIGHNLRKRVTHIVG